MSNSILVDQEIGVVVEVEDGTTILVESDDTATVIVEESTEVLVDEDPAPEVVVYDDTATVIETHYVLPTETILEEEQVYAKRVDFVGDTVIYRGEAAIGTAESSAAWRIRRITFVGADEDVVEEWAEGTGSFIHAWEDRAILSYS